jgi:hypothetical protein
LAVDDGIIGVEHPAAAAVGQADDGGGGGGIPVVITSLQVTKKSRPRRQGETKYIVGLFVKFKWSSDSGAN